MKFTGAEILGRGVYTIAEAALLTHLRTQRVREWFRGKNAPSRIFRPVFDSDYPVLDREYAISFLDLIELKIGGTLRDAGVSLPYLRKVYDSLSEEFGTHPFCNRQIFVGGKKIFTRGLTEEEGAGVVEALTNQKYFDAIILPFLKKIVYDDRTNQAIRWHIANKVVIDPAIRFGKPVVEGIGIATSVLRGAYYANGEDAAFVANWFGVDEEYIKAAVDFENQLAA